jgi:hypothetical protein
MMLEVLDTIQDAPESVEVIVGMINRYTCPVHSRTAQASELCSSQPTRRTSNTIERLNPGPSSWKA